MNRFKLVFTLLFVCLSIPACKTIVSEINSIDSVKQAPPQQDSALGNTIIPDETEDTQPESQNQSNPQNSDDASLPSDAVIADDRDNKPSEPTSETEQTIEHATNTDISFIIQGDYDFKLKDYKAVPYNVKRATEENLKQHHDAFFACFDHIASPDNPIIHFGLYIDLIITGDGKFSIKYLSWDHRNFELNSTFTSCIKQNVLSWTFPKQNQTQSRYSFYLYNYQLYNHQSNHVESERKRIEFNEFQTVDKRIIGIGSCYTTQEGVTHCPQISSIARCSQNQCECVMTNYDRKRELQPYHQYIEPCTPSDSNESNIHKVLYESSFIQIQADGRLIRKLCAVKDNQVSNHCECIMSNGEYDPNDFLLLNSTDNSSFEAFFVDCTNGHKLYH